MSTYWLTELEQALTEAGFAAEITSSGEEALVLLTAGDNATQRISNTCNASWPCERLGGGQTNERERLLLPDRYDTAVTASGPHRAFPIASLFQSRSRQRRS